MKGLLRWILLVLLAALALQLFFVVRIAAMAVIDPQSTSFQRSEAWRIVSETRRLRWRQQWVPYASISDHLKRAVIAAEDGSFTNHDGVGLVRDIQHNAGVALAGRDLLLIGAGGAAAG
ncbi:MAG: transglycosylase domain-containing protein, partial [Ramlibacter sp.]|nr:transglycosylase domain-containing protein [Ramlibacter sp.]